MSSGLTMDLRPVPGQGLSPRAVEFESEEYRRRARRLRCQLAGRPATLQRALGNLVRQDDAQRFTRKPTLAVIGSGRQMTNDSRVPSRAGDLVLGSVLGVAPASAQYLGRLVQESLNDGMLPYARRQDVLRAARRLGVGRFQANLLIAAVQHRHAAPAGTPEPGKADGLSGWGLVITAVVVIESAILLGAWWMVRV